MSWYRDHLFVILIILVSSLIQLLFLGNPTQTNPDEFYYISRAWTFSNEITGHTNLPIIYNDHPPMGWVLMGFFGTIIPWGTWTFRCRLFVWIIAQGDKILIYNIARKYFSKNTGIIAVVIYSFQIGILFYNKFVYLDNIGIFFILLAYQMILTTKLNRTQSEGEASERKYPLRGISATDQNSFTNVGFILSGIWASFAVLTKIPMILHVGTLWIFFFTRWKNPTLLVYKKSRKLLIKNFILWLIGFITPIILFVLILNYTSEYNYFIYGLYIQSNRQAPENIISSFSEVLLYWIQVQGPFFIPIIFFLPVLIILYFIAIKINQLYQQKIHPPLNKRFNRTELNLEEFQIFLFDIVAISSVLLGFTGFFLWNTIVFHHYIIPLFPFGSLLLGLIGDHLISKILRYLDEKKNNKKPRLKHVQTSVFYLFMFSILGLLIAPFNYKERFKEFETDYDEILDWIDTNIPKDSMIIVENYYIAELQAKGFEYAFDITMTNHPDTQYNWSNINFFLCSSLESITNSYTLNSINHLEFYHQFETKTLFRVVK
jgi:4-amino-4-deoxy-L-arabinose transferase-like glycosyltransferase